MEEEFVTFPGTSVRLHPQMYRLIMRDWDPAAPPVSVLTPEQVRAAAVPLDPVEPTRSVRDLEASGPNGPIPIRLYRPHDEQSNTAIVYLHGGGWVLGSVREAEDFSRYMSNTCRRPVLSVDYRLAPEHKFPQGLQDCFAAIEWIERHSAELGVHGDGLVVAGDSAGGNLAAAVAHLAREQDGPRIKGQVLVYPAVSFIPDTASILQAERGPWLSTDDMIWFTMHYLRSEQDARDPQASPLLIENFSGLPPALVINAEYDPLRDHARQYAARLIEAGVSTRYREYPGTVHGFLGHFQNLEQAQAAFEEIASFVSAVD